MKLATRSACTPGLVRRVAVVATLAAFFCIVGVSGAFAGNGKVLVLDSTISGGLSSPEALAATAAGEGVDVVNGSTWDSMTTAQFAAYDGLILGDPSCTENPSPVAAAESNSTVWSPAVTGKVIVIGTDPTYHTFGGVAGAQQLVTSGVDFAVSDKTHTGAYIALSCYYYSVAPGTPVPLLDHLSSFGTFQVQGQSSFVACPEKSHITASSPALAGLTDADLSNWSCSAHESFTQWPADFDILAINSDIGSNFTASDGTVGGPYILSRGATVISNISLSPASATNTVGQKHTVTATASESGSPVVGTLVTFTIVAGPNAGLSGTGTTNASGSASWTYSSSVAGTDLIRASFVDSLGRTESSNTVSKTWQAPTADCSTASLLVGKNSLAKHAVDQNVSGLAEAFRAVAGASGTTNVVCLYVDAASTATQLVAGIYADNGSGHPGALLSQGSISSVTNGAWNTVPVPPVALAAGTKYWITILSPLGTGTLKFWDHCCGLQGSGPAAESGPSENSKLATLTTLPTVWATGKVWPRDGQLLGWGGGIAPS